MILWAPPGCGKTTLAYLVAAYANAAVENRSAVTTGVADIRQIAKAAVERRRLTGQGTLLVLDEIHHFNRTQQDSLLGLIEDGTIQLVGVTTESPYFVLAPALLSRARVLVMRPLSGDAIRSLLSRALTEAAGVSGPAAEVTLSQAAG